MRSYSQLYGFLLYAFYLVVLTQSQETVTQPQERIWHSTTPSPVEVSEQPTTTTSTTTTSTEPPTQEPPTTESPSVPETTAEPLVNLSLIPVELEKVITENGTEPEEFSEAIIPTESVDQDTTDPQTKPRKWMSVPEKESEPDVSLPDVTEDILQAMNTTVLPQEQEDEENADQYSLNKTDFELPKNISDMLQAAEDGEEMVQETIIQKKTTVYVTISDSLGDREPVYVNLTGIRDFTGVERRIVSGCLDLSDLELNGEEAREVIQRMSKHKFHRLDLSNNKINEFPTNTFSPVAFTVRELRLDGNPLLSNAQGEGSVLQRGGLFHLTELRELNISSCGLKDIDFFTPWNSNRLEVVDLSANNLPSVPSNLQFFHKLKKLFLDGNPITQVTELPFALLWNVQVLSMSGCTIQSISSDPFRNMEHLKQLSLEGNSLKRIGELRLPRGSSGVKMYLSGNPWHCTCDMLNFVEYHHYAIRDIEDIRCASPRWLEGLRTAYLTKEILSLDSVDGDCSSTRFEMSAAPAVSHSQLPVVRTDRLETISLVVFALAAIFMMVHILWSKKSKDKYKFDEELRPDTINYIRVDRKPYFK